MPAGGRGYTRAPSLISVWSTAPFLLNNSLGRFDPSPSVEARMRSFQDSIEQLLWPEKREKDRVLGDKVPGVDRPHDDDERDPRAGRLRARPAPAAARPGGPRLPQAASTRAGIRIGPIPEGTPVNLLANVNLLPPPGASPAERLQHDKDVLELVLKVKKDLIAVPANATNEQAKAAFANLVDPLLRFSSVPGLRREPRPLLRDEPASRRSRG